MARVEFPNFCAPHNDLGLTSLSNFNIIGVSPLDGAVCQNLYPHTAEIGGRQRRFLIGRPGTTTPLATLATTPVRALIQGQIQTQNPLLYAVGGTHAYSVTGGGVVTDLGAMPSSTGVGPAKIVANGASTSIAPGNQTQVFEDYGAAVISYFNGANMVSAFNGRDLEYLDGFMVAIANGASLQNSNPNQINVSAFGDHTNWTPGPGNTQAFAIRTGGNDYVNALAVLNGFLWIFGQRVTEIWFNAGLSPFPFQRYQGATLNIGCLSPFSVVKFWDRIIWLAQDHTGFPEVRMTEGMSARRISTSVISSMLTAQAPANTYLTNAWAYGYQENGHTFYALNLFNGSSYSFTFPTLVYDVDENAWHTRLWNAANAAVPTAVTNAVAKNYMGAGNGGQIAQQGMQFASDVSNSGGAAQSITYIRQAPYISENNVVTKHNMFDLVADLGSDTLNLSYSDDWGQTFRSTFSLTAPGSDQGFFTPGNLKRYYARQLGRSRARIYQVSVTTQTSPIRIGGAYLDVDQGSGQ